MSNSPTLQGRFDDLGTALSAAAEQFGDRDAYVDGGTRLSFAEWDRASISLAAELRRRGVGRGDVVAIGLPSSAAFAICYVAAVRIGAIATGINTRLGRREIAGILRQSAARLLIGDVTTDTAIETIKQHELGELLGARSVLDATTQAEWGKEPGIGRHDPAVIIWTSGTTGAPKGAWYDHAGLEAAVHSSGVMSAPFDRRLVATPFAHAGYMAKVWDQIAWAIAFIVPPQPWSAASTALFLREEQVTVASLVPTQWAKMLEHEGGHRPFPHLRLGTSATAPASPDLIEQVKKQFEVPLVVRYAMTESPSITGTEINEPPHIQFRTVGRPQAGMDIRLVDDLGAAVPVGEVGNVEVHGACLMRGYWHDEETTRKALTDDGWLRTGDLGYRSPRGHLLLTGRRGEMYIRGGYNVYPLEVERVLSTHPLVGESAVIGIPAPVIGEIGVAFVVPSGDPAPTLDDLRDHVRSELADYKAPDRLVLLEALPRTAMMKVDRSRLAMHR